MDWQAVEYSKEIYALAKANNLSEILAKLVASRVGDSSDYEDYLYPKIKNLMPDPFTILDMEKGASFLVDSILQKKKIAIFGDYDVDGACSSALIARFLRHLNVDYKIYIPDRIMEGYGPNSKALMSLKDEGYDVVITVDCGTTAFDALETASNYGLDILVVDHHLSESKIPEAIAVMNPNRIGDKSGLNYLCGAGVSFMLLVAVNKLLKQKGYYQAHNIEDYNLLGSLDIVALATVCDVVPLVKLNRALVAFGLKVMANSENIGLRELFAVSNVNINEAKTFHLGFIIGPRINAGGRVGKSTVGSELLASFDYELVRELGLKLDHYNGERKAIEKIVLDKALEQITERSLHENNVIVVANKNWHPGVIGIVAARIKEKYNKPAVVIAIENSIGKASVRSIEGINIGALIHKAKDEGLLIAGGGHAMAAGFSVEDNKISILAEFMQNISNDNIVPALYDLEVSLAEINFKLLDELKLLEPFGKDNEEPVFLIKNLMVSSHFLMQEKHLKLMLVDKDYGALGNQVETILWNFDQFDLLPKIQNGVFNIICQLKENIWQGKRQMRLEVKEFLV